MSEPVPQRVTITSEGWLVISVEDVDLAVKLTDADKAELKRALA